MKLFGLLLLLIAAVSCGCHAADGLRKRVIRLQQLRRMLNAITIHLRYTLPTVQELLKLLSEDPDYTALPFLYQAAADPSDFPAAWQTAISESHGLSHEEVTLLHRLGHTLGTTDLEGQLSALALCDQQLAALQQKAAAHADSHGTLYRTMGVLTGLFLVILLF